MTRISIHEMPKDAALRSQAAAWSVRMWRDSFPNDSAQWYLNHYKESDFTKSVPLACCALVNGELAGVASVLKDDELPGADESGPWLAAVFVHPRFRRKGIGTLLVTAQEQKVQSLGFKELFAYTVDKLNWYESLGWQFVRTAQIANHPVCVIRKQLHANR